MEQPTLSRRDVLELSAVGATALTLPFTIGASAKRASRGPKDVVSLGENEVIRFIAQFGNPDIPGGHLRQGRYLLHCHDTSHEDHDMMFQMRVGEVLPGNDPIAGAPPRPGPPPAL